ncbi:transcriptional regulator [Marinitoga sp. 1197]|uniref:ArsR/SmtB family transcription factor n=1 Tax=unclassified Marinitoga TaxID=2640159 RepID=UPI000640E060|nr:MULTISPECIES: metalloregulator ArsR/SmtB family transcription factor [unclassified Marinitoga]KLO22453.1 hypothetical protein X274_08115 [Marinitoga sp. 1155]KLO23212.1 transcriptional regulator [Marinitoga sp. 1197]NUV00249.1 hypothetical protein [Marinitoga sp. 1154]
MDKYILISNIFKALSNPVRLKIIDIIHKKRCNVSKIIEELNLSQSNISQHLKVLEDAGLIKKTKKDNYVLCEIKYESILETIDNVDYIIEREIEFSRELMKK